MNPDPKLGMCGPAENTDRELWRERDDYYADSIHVTEGGGIGINVGGRVHVKPLKHWHALAERAGATPEPPTPATCPTCGGSKSIVNRVDADFVCEDDFHGYPNPKQEQAVTSSGAQPPDLTVRGSDEERAAHQLQVLEDWRGATQGSSPEKGKYEE